MAATPQGVKVEIAFTTTIDDPAPAWTDVTAYVLVASGITITKGRQNEFGQVQPGTCTLTVNNTDGRFTPGLVTGAYYPNVLLRKKLRVTTVSPAAVSSRFTGYVDSWPVQWPSGGAWHSETQIVAVDRFKRLSRQAEMTNSISEEILLDTPNAYYTLGEPSGSVTAGDTGKTGAAVASVVQVGSGGTLEFGASTGPGTDGLSAPLFTPADVSNGKGLSASLVPLPVTECTLECFFSTTSGAAGTLAVVDVAVPGTQYGVWLWISGSTHKVYAVGQTNGSAAVNDGLTHHVAVVNTVTSSKLYVDGVLNDTTGFGISASSAARMDIANALFAGSTGSCFAGTIAHAAFYPTALTGARILAHATAGLTGFVGERSDQRIARYASYAGIPTAEQDLETGLSTSISHYDTTGKTPLAAMQDITATEGGVLFIAGDGKLTFQARSHRYNAASTLTISSVNLDVRFDTDDQLLINDVTASRPNGITYRSVDALSQVDNGEAKAQLTLYVTTDNEVIDAADCVAHRLSTPQSRIGNLTVDILAVPSLATAMLGLEIGDRITADTLPAQAPAASVGLFVEGWTETIRTYEWTFALNTSPAAQSFVWQLDSAVYSILGVSTVLGY